MKIYDVTFPISEETPIYEGDPEVEIGNAHSIANGASANVSQISCGVHTGTHVDAPNHFIEGGRRVHELSFDKLLGDCTVIEFDESVMEIEAKHVQDLENIERVLFKTRNSAFWNDKVFHRDYTAVSPEAAEILVAKGVLVVGIDYLSVEKFGVETFETHLTFLKNEVVIIEGLDLREVPAGQYELICLPLKYLGGTGDGGPARTILREKV